MIQKPNCAFGLLTDACSVLERAGRNVRIASSNVHNLLNATKDGGIGQIPQADLVRILEETKEALDAIAN